MGFTEPDSPSSPEHFDAVAVQGMEPRPDLGAAAIAAATQAATAVWAADGPREQQAKRVMESSNGYGDFDILAGFSGQGETTHGWPNDVTPPDTVDNGGYGGA